MFNFGAREKYNKEVDVILTNDFQIITNQATNPRFPGILKYLSIIDEVWWEKLMGSPHPQAAATRVAVSYYGGLVKNGTDSDRTDADALLRRMQKLMVEYLANGVIEQNRVDYYSKVIEKHCGTRL